jgi:A/G-specific adenine glycosylase
MLSWSLNQFQGLPWRSSQRNFYTTLVSEFMLQQTTVETVKKRFPLFLQKFPTLQALASCTEEEVVQAWEGLGYYSRARRLRELAQGLASYTEDTLSRMDTFLHFKGIGPYTNSALMALAFNKRALAVDVNIARVYLRYYGKEVIKADSLNSEVSKFFSQQDFVGFNQWRAFNEALMDVGRIYCQARERHCLLCPLKQSCVSSSGCVDPYVVVKKVASKKLNLELARLVVMKKGEVALMRREKGQWLEGQWELPTFMRKNELDIAHQYTVLENDKSEKKWIEVGAVKSSITYYSIRNKLYRVSDSSSVENINIVWHRIEDLKKLTLSSVTKKLMKMGEIFPV